jgi:hypothetical protein
MEKQNPTARHRQTLLPGRHNQALPAPARRLGKASGIRLGLVAVAFSDFLVSLSQCGPSLWSDLPAELGKNVGISFALILRDGLLNNLLLLLRPLYVRRRKWCDRPPVRRASHVVQRLAAFA